MDFIRRKYLIYTVDNNLDFLRSDVVSKVNNFTLNHVLALKYLIVNFPRAVLTRDVFESVNFFVFLHMVRCPEVYEAVLKSAFDAPTLYVRALVRNYQVFADAVRRYKDTCKELLEDRRFVEVAGYSAELADVVGVNYDVSLNPLFVRGEPVRDMELIFTKMFRPGEFPAVKKLAVLRLLIWAYLCKQDTGLEFADDDAQDIYTLFQKTGPVVHSAMTEKFRQFMFPGDRTSYWVWLRERIANDADILKGRPARSMHERLLSYVYSEVKQGRANRNMLKLAYAFETDPEIRAMLLEIIYGVPGDILGIIDAENEEWKRYFVSMYRDKFVDGTTFASERTFRDDLFRVVAAIDPDFFDGDRVTALFNAAPETVKRFDEMPMNSTFVSRMVYGSADVDLAAAEREYTCQIYHEDTLYHIREYNTYLFLNEEDPLVLDAGVLVRLSYVPAARRLGLFSKSVLRYYLDGKLASMGIVLADYRKDIVVSMLSHLRCVEDVSAFVRYAAARDPGIVPALIRTIIANFNVTVIVLFQRFLQDHMDRVEDFFDRSSHLTAADKRYLRQLIAHGRS
ncbi:conserved hypothetical pox protein [Squirrelpox virus]|uniref:Protein E6 homolog n=1 Tax=Squirrelpox virus TaxID=240426 RepID=U3UB93_9POXV|nr:conserved hypothetical pox protein [Squirrelpox virus]CCD83212.1 conserved hypothetical pox protein [Squirrelpox virus]